MDAMSTDSTEVAERLFREAMRVEPAQRSNAMIYYQIGRMQEHRGKLEKALESYTMGLNVAPHVLPLRYPGRQHLLRGRGRLWAHRKKLPPSGELASRSDA